MLPNDVIAFVNADKQAIQTYHKLLIKYHPDRNKSNTTDIYLAVKHAYKQEKKYKHMEKEIYKAYSIDKVISDDALCACGMTYDIQNIDENVIDCEYCSLRIEVVA